MVAHRNAINLFKNYEQFICDIVERVENCIHELSRSFIVELKQTCSQSHQEELRICRILHTLVDELFEAFTFGETEKVLDRVAKPSSVVERVE